MMTKLSEFKPQTKNANKHTQRGEGLLEKSIREDGYSGEAMVAAANQELFIGSNRLQKSVEVFGPDVEPIIVESDGTRPVIVKRTDIETADDPRAIRLGLGSNRIAQLSLDWDVPTLQGFELPDLDLVGFNERELIDLKVVEPESKDAEPQVEIIGTKRQRWSFRHGTGFLSVRSFITEKKKSEIETLKIIKRERPEDITRAMAKEIAEMLKGTFLDLRSFVVTGAPVHKTGFSIYLARLVASLLEANFVELFKSDIDENAKRSIFGKRPEIKAHEIKNNIIWIDDTLTTGQTLEACRECVEGFAFIPIVWIYDDAQEQ